MLLRHTTTNLYFQSPGTWTTDPELALDFRFVDRALKFAETWRLGGVALACVFDDPQRVTTVPLEQAALRAESLSS
jgi:hypothetical protein